MSITDLIVYMKGLGISIPLFPLAFPASSPTEAIIVETGQGAGNRGSVYEMTWTFTVRADHPSKSEKAAQEIMDLLDKKTNQAVGDADAILIKSAQFIPQYLGKDSEDKHFHMVNFKVLIS